MEKSCKTKKTILCFLKSCSAYSGDSKSVFKAIRKLFFDIDFGAFLLGG